jgi:streptomycin 6-kinase
MPTEPANAVPADLILKGEGVAGEAGREWRRLLPATVANLVEEWSLTIGAPFPGLSYNYVAPVNCEDGTPAVLKVYFPEERAFRASAEALQLYDGDGAVRLLRVDSDRRAMLLERAEHGRDLWKLADEEQQIQITAAIMRRLWRPPPPDCSLPTAAAEFERMATLAPQLASSNFPLRWIATATGIFEDLESAASPVVLHEDLHQANILAAQREPWLAIDPHGLIGPPALDTIQMILNVVWREADSACWQPAISRYVHSFADLLKLEPEQIRLCGVARAVLEAFWTLEDEGVGWERDFAIVDAFVAAR